jgi:hypothetical protein
LTQGTKATAEELREGENQLQFPRRRKGNPCFLGHFFFFAFFFFDFGTEITCRSNGAVACLTLPTAKKFYQLIVESSQHEFNMV